MKVFLEGLPGAGKTTLLRGLEARGLSVVEEIGNTIEQHEFPGNGNTLKEVLEIDDWFIRKERERSTGVNGIFDRSFLTHLTYSYAYSRHTGIDAFESTISKYEDAILNKALEAQRSLSISTQSPNCLFNDSYSA